jgi:hypothetical protein
VDDPDKEDEIVEAITSVSQSRSQR